MKRRRTYGGHSHVAMYAPNTPIYPLWDELTEAYSMSTENPVYLRHTQVNLPLHAESYRRSRAVRQLSRFRERWRRARLWTFIVRNARNIRYGIIHARAVALQEFYNAHVLLPAVLLD